MGLPRKIRQDNPRDDRSLLSVNSANSPVSTTPTTDSKRRPPQPFNHSNSRQEKPIASHRFGRPSRVPIAETIDGGYTPPKRSNYFEYIYTVDDCEYLVLSLDGRRIFWAYAHDYYHGELLKALPVPINETGSFCTLRQINAPAWATNCTIAEDYPEPTNFSDHIRQKNKRVKKR